MCYAKGWTRYPGLRHIYSIERFHYQLDTHLSRFCKQFRAFVEWRWSVEIFRLHMNVNWHVGWKDFHLIAAVPCFFTPSCRGGGRHFLEKATQSAITDEIKIKYVMQMFKTGAWETFGLSLGSLRGSTATLLLKLEALGLMFRKMTFFCGRAGDGNFPKS